MSKRFERTGSKRAEAWTWVGLWVYISALLHIPLPSPPSLSARELQSPAGHFDIKKFRVQVLVARRSGLMGKLRDSSSRCSGRVVVCVDGVDQFEPASRGYVAPQRCTGLCSVPVVWNERLTRHCAGEERPCQGQPHRRTFGPPPPPRPPPPPPFSHISGRCKTRREPIRKE